MIRRVPLFCALLLVALPLCAGTVKWGAVLRQPAAWYATTEAHAVADNVVLWQTPSGGWPKNHDMTLPPAPHDLDAEDVRAPTIDNDACCRAAFQRGLDYLFAAQYANGGWPQFYPRLPGCYTHITFNDDAMTGVLVVRFLTGEENPSPEIIVAGQGAVAWFEKTKLTGIRVVAIPDPTLPHGHDRKVVADPAAPPLWARFYEIGTNRPIFGGRDTIIRYSLAEVEPERRGGYRWYVEEPARLLEHDYPKWAARWIKSD